MKKKPSVDELISKIEKAKGNIAMVARGLGVSRAAVYNWVSESAGCRQALEDARETMVDDAESILYKKVLEGSTPELLFFLKTQGKRRGYVERSEVTGADGGPLVIEYVNDWRNAEQD
jgi:predicted transcriptional regulator